MKQAVSTSPLSPRQFKLCCGFQADIYILYLCFSDIRLLTAKSSNIVSTLCCCCFSDCSNITSGEFSENDKIKRVLSLLRMFLLLVIFYFKHFWNIFFTSDKESPSPSRPPPPPTFPSPPALPPPPFFSLEKKAGESFLQPPLCAFAYQAI